jgi:hypothetical protein
LDYSIEPGNREHVGGGVPVASFWPTRETRTFAPAALTARGGRLFVTRNGDWWTVYEHPLHWPSGETEHGLVFESVGAFRRVRRFPTNWIELSDPELEALSWRV